ncbi:MAG: hypothetical protein CM15mV134_220 [uncultured marine virus]|nr:MAG: hypothetical protein CM15mV134_220 [uncultured marine virus]
MKISPQTKIKGGHMNKRMTCKNLKQKLCKLPVGVQVLQNCFPSGPKQRPDKGSTNPGGRGGEFNREGDPPNR